MQKNLKIMLAECDFLEQYGYNIRNKNNINEILKVVEQAIEKFKAQKRYSQNSYDWSSSLIIQALRSRFGRARSPSEEFGAFVQIILGGYEKDIEMQTLEMNMSISTLIKYHNQMQQRIDWVKEDFKYLEHLFRVKKRSQFIQNA